MSPQQGSVPASSDVVYLERALEQIRTDLLARLEDIRSDLRSMVTTDLYRAEQRLDELRMDHLAEGLRRMEATAAADREAAERRALDIEAQREQDRARTEATRRLLWSSLAAPVIVGLLVWLVTAVSS